MSRRPASITRSCSARSAVSSAARTVGHRALEVHRRVERLLRTLVREGVAEDCRQDADPLDEVVRPVALAPQAAEGDAPSIRPATRHRHRQIGLHPDRAERRPVDRGLRRKVVERGEHRRHGRPGRVGSPRDRRSASDFGGTAGTPRTAHEWVTSASPPRGGKRISWLRSTPSSSTICRSASVIASSTSAAGRLMKRADSSASSRSNCGARARPRSRRRSGPGVRVRHCGKAERLSFVAWPTVGLLQRASCPRIMPVALVRRRRSGAVGGARGRPRASNPLRILVPLPPASTSDVVARLIAEPCGTASDSRSSSRTGRARPAASRSTR